MIVDEGPRRAAGPVGAPERVVFAELDDLRGRRGCKWERYGQDVVAAWIADMDVSPPAVVRAAILGTVERGELGYAPDTMSEEVAAVWSTRCADSWGWRPPVEGVRLIHDVVQGIALAIECFTEPGDGIVVLTPSYPPILEQIERASRGVVGVELRADEGWALPIDRIADAIDESVSMVVLVNPHNPTGRSFRRDELEALASVLSDGDVVVLADEIHADLVWDGRVHVPFASVNEAVGARTVTVTSAAKAFNIAGLKVAVAHLGPELTGRYDAFEPALIGEPSVVAVAATLAAWRDGGGWLDVVAAELMARRDRLSEAVATLLPEVTFHPPEATYLAWLDCTALGLGDDPSVFFLDAARVALGRGPDFGAPGAGHVRLNFATSTLVLDEIVERMVTALDLRAAGSSFPALG